MYFNSFCNWHPARVRMLEKEAFFLLAVYITGNGIAAYDQTAGLGTLNKMDGDAFSVDKGVAKSNKQVPWS